MTMRTWFVPAALAAVVAVVGCSKKELPPPKENVDLSQAGDLFSQPVKTEAAPKADPNAVVAKVNGKDILRGAVDEELAKIMEMASRRVPPERLMQMQDRFVEQAVDNIVLKQLLTEEVDKQNVAATEEEFTQTVERITSSLPPGTTIEEVIARNKWTDEEFRKNVELDVRINKLLEKQTADMKEPTDEELQAFYTENKERFDVPETASARHILLATEMTDTPEEKAAKKAKAEDLQKKLVAGEDFAKAAAENSDDPGSKERGGELGTFRRGDMVKPFEEAVFSQKIDEIGPVVETQFGYHIIQVTERKEARTVPLDEVKERLAKSLLFQKRQEAARAFVEGLKAAAAIEYIGVPPPRGEEEAPLFAPPAGRAPARRQPQVQVEVPQTPPAPAEEVAPTEPPVTELAPPAEIEAPAEAPVTPAEAPAEELAP